MTNNECEKIQSTLNIVEIAERLTTLSPAGNYLRGTCPFCSKDSFTVSPARDIYYCFSCHSGGNAVMLQKKILEGCHKIKECLAKKNNESDFIVENWIEIRDTFKKYIFDFKASDYSSEKIIELFKSYTILASEVEKRR